VRRTTLAAVIWSAFILVVWAVVGGRSIRPDAIAAGETCFRCRHAIPDARLAAEMLNGPLPTKYKGPGCLARYLKAHPDPDADLYVTDFTTGALFNPGRGWFVQVVVNERTGGREYRAYLARTVAEAAAREWHTTAIRWTALVERAESQGS
jgi:hypothetical protein